MTQWQKNVIFSGIEPASVARATDGQPITHRWFNGLAIMLPELWMYHDFPWMMLGGDSHNGILLVVGPPQLNRFQLPAWRIMFVNTDWSRLSFSISWGVTQLPLENLEEPLAGPERNIKTHGQNIGSHIPHPETSSWTCHIMPYHAISIYSPLIFATRRSMESIGTPNDRDPHSKASYGSKADSETIGDSETAIQKLRFRNYFHRFRNYCDSETNAIQKLRFRNYRDSETIAIPKLSRFQNYRDSATITIRQLRFRNYREVLVSESARDPSYGRLWNGFSSSGVPSSTKKWAIIMVVGVISPTYGGYYMFLPYIPISYYDGVEHYTNQ